MYTQCPNCNSVFRVKSPELTRADGMVRCGQCGEVFNAMDSLTVLEPETPLEESPEIDASREPLVEHAPLPHAEELFTDEREPEPDTPAAQRIEPAIPRILAEDLKPARTGSSGPSTASTVAWGLGILALILLLIAQYTYYQVDQLSHYPELQPALKGFCRLAGCEVTPRRDVTQIEMLKRNIYSHPNADNALMITATFVNNAPFEQPFPQLQISLSNIQGQRVAMRRFTPQEYTSGSTDAQALLAPGTQVNVTLEVADPGSHALNFEFDFL